MFEGKTAIAHFVVFGFDAFHVLLGNICSREMSVIDALVAYVFCFRRITCSWTHEVESTYDFMVSLLFISCLCVCFRICCR